MLTARKSADGWLPRYASMRARGTFPPAGALGHTVASLFGVDPKRAMDEDMVRLKYLLEEGKRRRKVSRCTLKR